MVQTKLNAAQALAQSDSDEIEPVVVLPEGDRLHVRPSGCKRGVHHRWMVEWHGVVIGFTTRRSGGTDQTNAFIRIPGETLLAYGDAQQLYEDVKAMLATFGYVIEHAVPSRVDMCIDMANVHCSEFVQAHLERRTVTRARKAAIYEDNYEFTGLAVGVGKSTSLNVRIYDKLTEVKDDEFKLGLMVDRRWGGKLPETATRVEFEIKRDTLREQFDIGSIEELWTALPSIAEWLTHSWFRVTDQKVDRENDNQNRAGASRRWQQVQQLFAEVFAGDRIQLERRETKGLTGERLIKQAMGCLTSCVAAWSGPVMGPRGMVEALKALVEDRRSDLMAAYEKKRDRLTTAGKAYIAPVPF
ncbi:MAG: hypothetical protein MI757_14695 [Pirellulales bacterium]|nr:hypothetical protein [Pirellulales bacterium]